MRALVARTTILRNRNGPRARTGARNQDELRYWALAGSRPRWRAAPAWTSQRTAASVAAPRRVPQYLRVRQELPVPGITGPMRNGQRYDEDETQGTCASSGVTRSPGRGHDVHDRLWEGKKEGEQGERGKQRRRREDAWISRRGLAGKRPLRCESLCFPQAWLEGKLRPPLSRRSGRENLLSDRKQLTRTRGGGRSRTRRTSTTHIRLARRRPCTAKLGRAIPTGRLRVNQGRDEPWC